MTRQDERTPSRPTPRLLENLPPTDAGQLKETKTRHEPSAMAITEIDAAWTPYFRYDSIYNDQREAIDSFLDILAENGYYLKEGACGTGKTLAAVTASIHAMRDPDELADRVSSSADFPTFDRTIVVTPVKQQLQQFIGELRGVNEKLPAEFDPVRTVVLRGRSDMMAIKNTELPGTNERDDIQDLREITRELIKFGSDIPLNWPREIDPPAYSQFDYDWSDSGNDAEKVKENYPYDPVRARAVGEIVKNLERNSSESYDKLQINGIETPYPAHIPHSQEVADAGKLRNSTSNQLPTELQGRFDPFYAATFSGLEGSHTGFKNAPNQVVDRKTLFVEAISRGRCPHELMGILAQQAELVLGNYNHLLDPETRYLTDGKLGLLDERTIVVVDEAHQLEERSRERLSTSVDIYTLDKALNDVEIARHYATGNIVNTPTPGLNQSDGQSAQKIARRELYLEPDGVEIEELIAVENLLEIAKQELIKASEKIEDRRFVGSESRSRSAESMASPTNPEWGDHLTNAIKQDDSLTPSVLQTAEKVMSQIEDVFASLAESDIVDRTPQGEAVGAFFRQWAQAPHEVYHPEARLLPSEKETFPEKYPDWVEYYTPELRLFNCIPQRELRQVFAELGGGVLMSATLRPIDPFQQATGINSVPHFSVLGDEIETEDNETTLRANGITDEMLSDIDTRPTTFDRFPLRFSPDSRLSLGIDLPRFTQSERGRPYDDDGNPVIETGRMSDTREKYARLIAQVARTAGNILIAMPSYEEAAWAHDFIQTLSIEKRCLVDQSTTSDETDELLEEFFEDGEAILCTGLRGTITEGVDFDGDKLHTCLNIGVPLPPGSSRRDAVEVAYQRAINSTSGRDAAQYIPSTRKVRQSIGRVIRGTEEAGVRIIADERYGTSENPNLRRLFSPQQQREFTLIEFEDVEAAVARFWDTQS